MNAVDEVVEGIANALIEASTTFRPDQIKAYERTIAEEDNEHCKWVLEKILENAEVAKEKKLPLCDDTGIPHVIIEIGESVLLPERFFQSIELGIARGLRDLPGRPMAVKGNDLSRISQCEGLYDDPGCVELAPIHVKSIPGNSVKVTVLMLGGGPEIRGRTMPIFHKHSETVVFQEMIKWAQEGTYALGCQPCVLAYGIGRSNYEAATLALEALAEGNFLRQSEIERRITSAVNETRVGALGLGGNTTVLATFLKVGPQRASGVRIVSLRTGCCYDPRKATVEFKF